MFAEIISLTRPADVCDRVLLKLNWFKFRCTDRQYFYFLTKNAFWGKVVSCETWQVIRGDIGTIVLRLQGGAGDFFCLWPVKTSPIHPQIITGMQNYPASWNYTRLCNPAIQSRRRYKQAFIVKYCANKPAFHSANTVHSPWYKITLCHRSRFIGMMSPKKLIEEIFGNPRDAAVFRNCF